jgi:hypothetical protein
MMRFLLLVLLSSLTANAQELFPDDPLEFEPKPVPVTEAAVRKLSDYYDLVKNTFDTPGELNRKTGKSRPAQAVNTLGEPMQGAWWVKRHYYKTMSLDELVAGPGSDHPPSLRGPWTVVGAKSEGITPGFVILDVNKEVYFIKFDPLTNPEMATGADEVSNRLVYALGYHVPENYLVEFSRETLVLGKEVMLADRLGRRRRMTGRDLTELILKVPKNKRGRYRATASRAIPGKGIGPYRYHGTRRDDPNDFVPHEHRRDLRGFAIVSAWIGHDDSRAINTYDALVEENGGKFIKHYILDLGSTLGSGTQRANSPRSGGEYLFGWKQSAVQLFSLGLAVPYWAKASFPDLPSIGRFEFSKFDPERWVPEYPNPAFLNRLPDDEFWAAKQIMSLSNEQIRAIVGSGQYSDPEAAEWLAKCLIERRDKIGRAFYKKVLPIDRFEVRDNQLMFEDLSEKAGFGAAGPYRIQWFEFDNGKEATSLIPGATTSVVPTPIRPYLVARIANESRPAQLVDVTVRLEGSSSPTVVGIDRRW